LGIFFTPAITLREESDELKRTRLRKTRRYGSPKLGYISIGYAEMFKKRRFSGKLQQGALSNIAAPRFDRLTLNTPIIAANVHGSDGQSCQDTNNRIKLG
jgi:hypothetical protein